MSDDWKIVLTVLWCAGSVAIAAAAGWVERRMH